MQPQGNLYLIPCTLGDTAPLEVLPLLIKKAVEEIDYYIVEHEKNARRFIKSIVPKKSAPVYCATKAGVHIFTKVLRYQLEKTSIKVFEVIPPLVDTEMTKDNEEKKVTPEFVAKKVIKGLKKDKYEIHIGKVKLLFFIHRLFPSKAYKILKNS